MKKNIYAVAVALSMCAGVCAGENPESVAQGALSLVEKYQGQDPEALQKEVWSSMSRSEQQEVHALLAKLGKEQPLQSAPIKQDLSYSGMQGLLSLMHQKLGLKKAGETVAALDEVQQIVEQEKALSEAEEMLAPVLKKYGAYDFIGFGVEKYEAEERVELDFASAQGTLFKVFVPLTHLGVQEWLKYYAKKIIDNWPQKDDERKYEFKIHPAYGTMLLKVDGKAVSSF